ncbi:MAG: response regulator [Planctomycetota bacterium]|jgi:DNA-binding response OmpR family regulator
MAKAKIVVTDDDPEIRDTMKALLETRGYTVVTAADREEGMEAIRRERPDLAIIDAMMTSWQDGFDMSRELKKDAELKDMPVLMLTGVREKTGIDFKSSAGDPTWLPVDAFLEKPAEPDVLFAQVEKLLSGRSGQ